MNNHLATYIHSFLQDYLSLQKGYSRHTILSYRDTIKLLLQFVAGQKGSGVANLTLDDLEPSVVIAFLEYLEEKRHNAVSTRNIRLACIHSFFGFVAERDPVVFDQCRRILAVPFKRTASAPVQYLEPDEMSAILKATENGQSNGCRDHALFSFMYNTGARVQEVIDLRVNALQLERPHQVRIVGKGGKQRMCPLWPDTVKDLRSLLDQRSPETAINTPVFVNRRGEPLTRYGVRYLLTKHVRIATRSCPSLKRKQHIYPHTIRHTTAAHMLQSGVDINTIRDWLGHVRLETTNRYAEVNLPMKREVLNKYFPVAKAARPWKGNEELVQWLESL